MKKRILPILLSIFGLSSTHAQDTFSIVAVDSATGEVGSAGASCVDLYAAGLSSDDFLGQLIPGVGAINTQAYYLPANQNNATSRMQMGETPSQIINWLVANDVQSQPELRQYGIAALVNGSPQSAAYTGSSTDNYKNHIEGTNYSIQGNILLGQEVLDSMESRFLNEPGDLACKLMAALQGANMVGADSRCSANGTSSLFAYVKVAKTSDVFGSPSFKVSVRTRNNSGIEPIDSLQNKFDLIHNCNALSITDIEEAQNQVSVNYRPSLGLLSLKNLSQENLKFSLYDITGRVLTNEFLQKTREVEVSHLAKGLYLLQFSNNKTSWVNKVLID